MTGKLTKIARMLRQRSTEAEKVLWGKLKGRQLEGCKFRRQQPVGPYIVDFVSFEKGIIIELDGGQHATNRDRDEEREAWLRSEGFQIIRFWNNDVFENLEGVLEVIRRNLTVPSPKPSHQGRGIICGLRILVVSSIISGLIPRNIAIQREQK